MRLHIFWEMTIQIISEFYLMNGYFERILASISQIANLENIVRNFPHALKNRVKKNPLCFFVDII